MTDAAAPTQAERAGREARGAAVSMLTLLAQAAMVFFPVLLTRALGVGGYGLYTMANNVVDFVSIVTLFGMDAVLARSLSIAVAHDDRGRAARAVAGALRVVVISGLVAGVLLGLFAPAVAGSRHEPALVTPLRTLVLVPIAYHATSVFLLATQALLKLQYEFWARGVVQPLLLLGLTALALRLGGGVGGACAAVAAGMALTGVLAATFYGREYPLRETLRAALREPTDWAMVRLGLPLVAMNLVAALRGRIDSFFLLHYGGFVDVGAYNSCIPFVATLFQVRSVFYPLIAATIPALIDRGDTVTLNAFLRRQTRWVATLALPLFVLFAGFGDGLLAVYGKDFVQARGALAILSVGFLASALSVSTWALTLSGNARYSTYSALTSVALQCVLPPVLVPRFGIKGAALSHTLALLVSETMGLYFARRKTGAQGLSPALLKTFLAAALAFLAGRAAQGLAHGVVARFLVGVGVALVAYLVVTALLGIDPEDRAVIASGLARLRRRRADGGTVPR